MEEQGSPKSLLFIFWNKRVNVPFIPFSHLAVMIDGTSLLVYGSGCSAGEDAAFSATLSKKRAGSLYAAARRLHPHTSASGPTQRLNNKYEARPNAFPQEIKRPKKRGGGLAAGHRLDLINFCFVFKRHGLRSAEAAPVLIKLAQR